MQRKQWYLEEMPWKSMHWEAKARARRARTKADSTRKEKTRERAKEKIPKARAKVRVDQMRPLHFRVSVHIADAGDTRERTAGSGSNRRSSNSSNLQHLQLPHREGKLRNCSRRWQQL
eukprot:4344115-Amphidinium_carterae.1